MGQSHNIVLTGFMGTGKTTVGKIISKKLGYPFVDIDELIEKAMGMRISEIFEKFGEARFRDIESAMISHVTEKTGQVISTGGGAILKEENLANMKKKGVVFCLNASADTVFERVKHNDDRPLLRSPDVRAKIKELMDKRRVFYEKADYMIETENLTPEEIAEEIINIYKEIADGKN